MKQVILKSVFVLCIALVFQTNVSAQELYGNRVVSKYFSKSDLQFIEQNDPAKFIYLKNYYLHSFILEPVVCTGCSAFVAGNFDITNYNSQRLPNARNVIVDSINGYKVTLLSQHEFEVLCKFDETEHILKSESLHEYTELPADFPAYVNTGDVPSDLENYLTQTALWINTHPAEFNAIKNSVNSIHFIKASEFLKLSSVEQQSIIAGLNKCIILNDTQTK